jgi:hypothetical protein
MSKTLFEELKAKSQEHKWSVWETDGVVFVRKRSLTEIDFFALNLLNDRRFLWIVRASPLGGVEMCFWK